MPLGRTPKAVALAAMRKSQEMVKLGAEKAVTPGRLALVEKGVTLASGALEKR